MPSNLTILLLVFFILAVCLSSNGVYAFGAGNIPSFAYMEGRAFRHGDIEDVLAELAKKGGGSGFAIGSLLKGGSKFGGLDIKRIYFGNWLRDYSQAVDIFGLKKLQLQTIVNLCMALGFLAHGYATHEFEVTIERLGVYLPTEHIDNPKGYGDGEDARKYHPQLRGPVDPRELEVDPRTGMKNYIANEHGGWDTSKALVRRTLEKCIHLGRQYRSQNRKQDLYEAYRLLGTLLHTLEDYPAHSNFCELALVSMGHNEVFTHVGDHVRIQAPNGKWVAPIVTGTFGSSDFFHSLLGEAGDHLSEASVTDLNKKLDQAKSQASSNTRGGPGSSPSDPATTLRGVFTSVPGGMGNDLSRDMEDIEQLRANPVQNGKRPEEMNPQELHAVLWKVLTFRDSVVKKIEKTIEAIPGLGPLLEKLMESISVFIFTTLEPFLRPILKSSTSALSSASGEVIDSHDQYEVFNDPRASDPTHSFLSKDHFNLILNEPAGNLAKIIVTHTVQLVVKAWDDTSINVNQLSEDATSCLFHPDFHNSNSAIQRQMLQYMREWLQGQESRQRSVLQRLGKNQVRNHQNIRAAGEGGAPAVEGTYAANQGAQASQAVQNYLNQIPGVAQASSLFGGGAGQKRDGDFSSGSGNTHHSPSNSQSGPTAYHQPDMTGQASSFYNPSGHGSPPVPVQAGFPAPPHGHGSPAPAFPGSDSSYGGGSTYAPPGQSSYTAPSHAGYTPSYSSHTPSSYPGGPLSGAPSFPTASGFNESGYPPPGGLGFPDPGPGGFGMPSAPSFPGADTQYGGPPQFPGGPSYPGQSGGGYYPPSY